MKDKKSKKVKKIRVTLYLSHDLYKIFLAICTLLSTSASSEVDKLILAKILFWRDNLTDKKVLALINVLNLKSDENKILFSYLDESLLPDSLDTEINNNSSNINNGKNKDDLI